MALLQLMVKVAKAKTACTITDYCISVARRSADPWTYLKGFFTVFPGAEGFLGGEATKTTPYLWWA